FPFDPAHLGYFAQEFLDTPGKRFELTAARRFVQATQDTRGPGLIGVLEDVPGEPEQNVFAEQRADDGVEHFGTLSPFPRTLREGYLEQQAAHPAGPLPAGGA